MQPTGPSDPPDPPAPPGDEPTASPPAAPTPAAPAPAFAPFFVPPVAPSAPPWAAPEHDPSAPSPPPWAASAASGHDPSWGAPVPPAHAPAPHAPPPAAAPPPVASLPVALLPPGYGASPPGAPDAPRWIPSAALPPGYEPETNSGQPDVVLFFRIYSGLACLSGAGAACWGLYEGIQKMHYGGFQLVGPVFYGVMGTIAFGVYLLGVILPRRPWMHVVGIIQLGLGVLGSCCTWPVVVPLLIYWLKPEVKKWFDDGVPKLGE